MDRREFLKMIGSGTLFSLLFPLLPAEVRAEIEKGIAEGSEEIVKSVCQQCPAGCGILVRCIGGWPVKIDGNPLHPVNHGTLCPLGFAGIFAFYDPDRIRTPLKRIGPRGASQWEAISWDAAIGEVAGKLKDLKDNNQSNQLVIIDGEHRGLMRVLFEHFSLAVGTPNYIGVDFSPIQGPVEALHALHGLKAEPSYDIANAGTVFLFNSDILEASPSPAELSQAWGRMRRSQKGRRGRAIFIGPRLSPTASKCDEWVPVRPGTEGILAMGLSHVLIKESLIDSQFVDSNCNGFYGEKGIRSVILSEFGPHTVSEKTGVDIPTIFRLAREFVRQRPAVAISGRVEGPTQVAIHLLNVLAGSINVKGGVLLPRRIDYGVMGKQAIPSHAPILKADDTPDPLTGLTQKFIAGEPYKTDALFLYYTNPVFSRPNGDKFKDALAKIPFIVSFSPFMDETTALADLVLPDRTFLERWQDVPTSTLDGFPVLGISRPVRKTLYNTRHTGDVILDIAQKLGTGLLWPNFESLLEEWLKKVFDFNKGDVFGDESETSWTKLLERTGWWSPSYENTDEFRQMISERGGWWDPSYHTSEWARVVATPSGKIELGGVSGANTLAPDDPAPEYPLALMPFRVLPWLKPRAANYPWLTDIAGPHLFERWQTWAELNPETAAKLNISDRDEVWVTSKRGRIRAKIRIFHGIAPDVVAVPIGLGHTSGGRYIEGFGSNPLSIIEEGEKVTNVRIDKV